MAMAWVLPPAVGLVQCLRHTQILPFLHHVSSWGVPTTLIAIQTIFITFLCTLFMLEDVGSSFWVFTAVSAQLQLVMYITMFLAALRLQVSMLHYCHATASAAIVTWHGQQPWHGLPQGVGNGLQTIMSTVVLLLK